MGIHRNDGWYFWASVLKREKQGMEPGKLFPRISAVTNTPWKTEKQKKRAAFPFGWMWVCLWYLPQASWFTELEAASWEKSVTSQAISLNVYMTVFAACFVIVRREGSACWAYIRNGKFGISILVLVVFLQAVIPLYGRKYPDRDTVASMFLSYFLKLKKQTKYLRCI